MPNNLQDEFPGINLFVNNNSLSALEAVSTGQANAYVGNLANAKYLKALPTEIVEARS